VNVRRTSVLALLALAAACSDSGKPKPTTSTTMRFSGTVLLDTGSGQPSALGGATVRASVDRDGDGVLDDGEAVTAESASDGGYAVELPVKAGDLAVLRFSRSGDAPVVRAVRAAPGGDMLLSATLRKLEALDCNRGSCSGPGGLSVAGLPPDTGGSARVFNPVTETSAFPGAFSDSKGDLLQSGVFATFALEDGDGQPVERLTTPATIKMRIPADTWSLVRDVTPGNGRIDVPLYAFDEVKGTWVREGSGHVEDQDGVVLAEAAAGSIRAGTFAGSVFAVGDVTHFSSWNCDWPVDTHGSVGGSLSECWWNGERKPCAGATVTARGTSYTGTSTPETVGQDGRFAIDVMRSEAPGEDLDGDGVTGEPTRVAVRVTWDGRVYDVGSTTMPTTPASGDAPTKDLGALVLDGSNLVEAGLCAFGGTVRTADGLVAPEAIVYGWDAELPDDLFTNLCFGGGAACAWVDEPDAAGAFSLNVPIMYGLTVTGMQTRVLGGDDRVVEYAWGSRSVEACPTAPVALTLDQGYIAVTPTVTRSGAALAWAPAAFGAAMVEVWSPGSTASVKWLVSKEAGTMTTPITYGVVPAGATQVWPESGAPAALASGDTVWIWLAGTTPAGMTYFGSGELVVP